MVSLAMVMGLSVLVQSLNVSHNLSSSMLRAFKRLTDTRIFLILLRAFSSDPFLSADGHCCAIHNANRCGFVICCILVQIRGTSSMPMHNPGER